MFSAASMNIFVSAALALASAGSILATPIPGSRLTERNCGPVPSPAFVVYTDSFIDSNILPPASSLAVSSLPIFYDGYFVNP